MSNRNTLKHRVECDDGSHHTFEVIAAFNHEGVAIEYARDCHHKNFAAYGDGRFKYRVMTLRSNKWCEVWSS